MANVKINNLADAVMQELQDYSDEVTEQLKKEVKQVAKECVKEIKQNAPELTGDYVKSWRQKTVFESSNDIRVVVHSKDEYRLTHLLEYGHAKVNGGRVPGKAHIRPAELNAEEKLLKKVKVVVKGGNS